MRNLIVGAALAAGVVVAVNAQSLVVPAIPIDPGGVALPDEAASAKETRFAFVAYGDTRGQADGFALQTEHGKVVDRMITEIKARASSEFPVRFVVQSGDGVNTG